MWISYIIFDIYVIIDFEFIINGYSMYKFCFGCVLFMVVIRIKCK